MTAVRRSEHKFAQLTLDPGIREGTISGYASLFGLVDLGGDRVARGAFARSISERGARGIRMLFQHDPDEVIGTWTAISEDQAGLHVEGRINTETARGREILALLRDGAIDGLSIGFRTLRDEADPEIGIRTILEADLWEISIVTFPMLPDARISEVKNRRTLPSVRQFERWLTRDAGLTRGEARTVIAKGYSSLPSVRDAATRTMNRDRKAAALAALIRDAATAMTLTTKQYRKAPVAGRGK